MLDQDAGLWVGPDDGPDTYRLVSLLGRGGEGAVWKAELPLSATGRGRVAIKIQPDPGDPGSAAEWTRYGRLLAAVHHPGLVRVREVFVGAERHPRGLTLRAAPGSPAGVVATPAGDRSRYVVMDFVEGRPLPHWIEEHPNPGISHRLRLLGTVADALDELHSGRQTAVPVAHGDVKPGNMIVTADDATVLVDLGGTRLADGPGEWLLTASYAAPELYGPTSTGTTPAADRFAFVASVVHLLVDVPPVLDAADRLDVDGVARQLAEHPRTANEPALAAELVAALRAEPERRPASLAEFLSRLSGLASRRTSTRANALVPPPAGPARIPGPPVLGPTAPPAPPGPAGPPPPPGGPSPMAAAHVTAGRGTGRGSASGPRRRRVLGASIAAGAAVIAVVTGVVLGLPDRDGTTGDARALPEGTPTTSVSAVSAERAAEYGVGTTDAVTPAASRSITRSVASHTSSPSASRKGSPRTAASPTGAAAPTTAAPAPAPTVTVTRTTESTTTSRSSSSTAKAPATRTGTVNSCNTYGQNCNAKNIYVNVPPDGYNYQTFPRITTAPNGSRLTARCWAEGGRTYNWAAKIATPDPGPNPYDSTIYYNVQVPGSSQWGWFPDTYFVRDKGGRMGLPGC